jgi:hypothetical protein
MLKDLIAAYMTDGTPVRKLFDGDQAPLGSLGARTCVAQSLGLISTEEGRDLEILRKVRNKFAHHADASFDRRDIRDTCMEMKLCEQTDNENGHDPAYRFMNSAMARAERTESDASVWRATKAREGRQGYLCRRRSCASAFWGATVVRRR